MSIPKKFMTDVKKQHTVPRFLLNKFAVGKSSKKKQLYTFDKINERTFKQSVYDATTRNTFYNIDNHPEKASLEPILGAYETKSAPLIKKIIDARSIEWLTEEDKINLASFIAVQKARSYGELQRLDNGISQLLNRFKEMGFDQEEVSKGLEPPDRKKMFLEQILNQDEIIAHFMAKSWVLYSTKVSEPFFISDNPVTLHNDIDMGDYGNLGIGLKGIQIHLPLSSTLTLVLLCPSITQAISEGRKKIERLIVTAPHILRQFHNPLEVIKLDAAYKSGKPIEQTKENVRFLNSLQVSFSEQYIFCENDSFDLVREMINDNAEYKTGPRMRVN